MGWIRQHRKWQAGGSAGAGISMDLSFQFSIGMCFCSFSCAFQRDLWDVCEQSYLVLMRILVIDRAEDILFVIFHLPWRCKGKGKFCATYQGMESSWRCDRGFVLREGNMLCKIFLVNISSIIWSVLWEKKKATLKSLWLLLRLI